jgi:hypothetical protein
MEGIELVSALVLLLRADLRGARKRLLECCLKLVLACNLAADVADEAAEPDSQAAQLPPMALELCRQRCITVMLFFSKRTP